MMYLRPLNPDRDAEALHAIFGDDESCLYMPEPATKSVAETRAMLTRYTTGQEDASWAVCDTPEGEALGRVALIPRERQIWEAACMFAPAARGRGLATAALAQVINEAFEKRGARRVFADIDPDNLASLRVFEKLGFAHEGVLRGMWDTHIGVRDSVIMGMLNTDFRPWR